jgi:Zn-dependent protease
MTLTCGRIAGIPVRVHWSALLVAAYLAYSLGTVVSIPAAAFGVLCFGFSILVHEVGHAIVEARFNVATTSIDLWALGGVARLATEAPTPRSEGFIAGAGPAASALAALFCFGAWWVLPFGGIIGEVGRVLLWLSYLNIALALFNMLPGSPLDGGRVLRAIRWRMHDDRLRACREAARSGVVVGCFIVGAALLLVLRGSPSISILLVGLFVLGNARAELAYVEIQGRVKSISVGAVAWRFLAEFDIDTSVSQMLSESERLGGAEALIVLDGGTRVGLVLLAHAERVPLEERNRTILGDLSQPTSNYPRATQDQLLNDMLGSIDPLEPVILMTNEDEVVGIVPPSKLRNLLEI